MHNILTPNHAIQTSNLPRIGMMTGSERHVHGNTVTLADDPVLHEVQAEFVENCAAHDGGDSGG